MNKIKVSMHTTLDGFAAGPNGEMDWIKFDSEMFELVKTFTDNSDTALYGRVTWQMMDYYWPTVGDKPNASKHDKEHSAWYNSVNKIVVSNSMKGQKADKTTFLGGDIATQVNDLNQKNGKDILIFGSPSVVRSLTKDNIIDEYWLFVNPIILGQGISIFTKLDNKIDLIPRTTKAFSCGVTALNFTTK